MITREQIRLIKKCNYLGIRLMDGETKLECGFRDSRSWPHIETIDIKHRIDCYRMDKTPVTAFSYEDNYDFIGNSVMLLANILKPGDIITARWLFNNSSPWSERRELVRDEVHIGIQRPAPARNDPGRVKLIGGFVFDVRVADKGDSINRLANNFSHR